MRTSTAVLVKGFKIVPSESGIEAGIYVWPDSSGCTIMGNVVAGFSESVSYSRNWYGIRLEGSGNLICENNIADNDYGILGYSAMNNVIHHNNFENSKVFQVYGFDYYTNTWDNGYPSGGNHWSDYQDTDLYKGPNQNLPGSDGIWDHPYSINAYNMDRYPLVRQYVVHGLTVSIYTDKPSYHVGETMHLGLDIVNPSGQMQVCFAIWIVRPGEATYLYLHMHNIALPANFAYSNPDFATIALPNLPPGIYVWHAAFLIPSTHKIITEDTAQWQFS